jgi:hypothetical protein
MKTHLGIASLSVVTVLCLALAVVPALADSLYNNGPVKIQANGGEVNYGFVLSDSSTMTRNSTFQGFAEPSTVLLLGSGILGFVTLVRRRLIDD